MDKDSLKTEILNKFNESSEKTLFKLRNIIETTVASKKKIRFDVSLITSHFKQYVSLKELIDEKRAESIVDSILDQRFGESSRAKRQREPKKSTPEPSKKKKSDVEKPTKLSSSEDLGVYLAIDYYKNPSDKKDPIIGDRHEFEKKTSFGSHNVLIYLIVCNLLIAVKSRNSEVFSIYKNLLQKYLVSKLSLGGTSDKDFKDEHKSSKSHTIYSSTIGEIETRDFLLKLVTKAHPKIQELNTKYNLYTSYQTTPSSYYYFTSYTQYLKFIIASSYLSNNSNPVETVISNILWHMNEIINDQISDSEYYKGLLVKNIREQQCCYICGFKLNYDSNHSFKNMQIDHIIPEAVAWVTGVIHTPYNYELAHQPCNGSKSNSLPISISDIMIDEELKIRLQSIKPKLEFDESIIEQYSKEITEVFKKLPLELQTQENYSIIVERAKSKLNMQRGGLKTLNFDKLILTERKSVKLTIIELYSLLNEYIISKNYYAIGILLELIKYFNLVDDIIGTRHHKSHIMTGGMSDAVFNKIQAYFRSFSNKGGDNYKNLQRILNPTDISNCDKKIQEIRSTKDEVAKGQLIERNTVCMMDETRANYYINRIILFNEFSNNLYQLYKTQKGYQSYTDFIVERFQRLMNFNANKGLTFFD